MAAGLLIGLGKPKKDRDPSMGMDMGMPMDDEDSDGYSAAKKEAAEELATALGVDPAGIDAQAVCSAVKKILELESE